MAPDMVKDNALLHYDFSFAIILVEGDPHKGQGDAAAVAASGQCPGPGNEQWERAVQP